MLEIFRRKEYVITVDSRPAKEQIQQAIRDKLGLTPAGSRVLGIQAAGTAPGA